VPQATCDNTLINNIKCHRERRYFIGKAILKDTTGANTQWLRVCATCDRQLGRQNLLLQGWNIKDAMKLEKDPDMDTPISNQWSDGASSRSAPRPTPSQIRKMRTAFDKLNRQRSPLRTRSKAL